MAADPISLITFPARVGIRLATLPLRVLKGALLGGNAEEVRFRPAPSPTPPPPTRAETSRKPREAPADTGPGPEIHVEPPWPDYDELSISDLLLRIEQATPAEKAVVLLYERQAANREAVLHVVKP